MNFHGLKSDLVAESNEKQMIFRIEKTGEAKQDLILSQEFNGKKIINNFFNSNLNNNYSNENKNKNTEKIQNFDLINYTADYLKANPNPENNLNQTATLDSFVRKLTKKSVWTPEEDRKLSDLIALHGKKSWKEIAKNFTNKSRKQCFVRWRKHLGKFSNSNVSNNKAIGAYRLNSDSKEINNGKKAWNDKEDEIIKRWVSMMGNKNWTKCSKLFLDKSPKDCKTRWFEKLEYEESNTYRCASSSDYWGKRDEMLLLLFIRKFGTCWSKLAKFFENKSGNQIKNKFYCLARLAFKNTQPSASNGFQMEVEPKGNFIQINCFNNNNDSSINHNFELEEEEVEQNSDKDIKEKAEKIIAYLVNSKDEYVYSQNLRVFREAKKFYNDRVSAIFGSSQSLNNCISDLETKSNHCSERLIQSITKAICENNENKVSQAEEEAKRYNICSGCLNKLRNHVKRRIITRLQSSNINLKMANQQMVFSRKFASGADKEINFSFNANVDKSKILDKIPQLFELINSLKEKIVN